MFKSPEKKEINKETTNFEGQFAEKDYIEIAGETIEVTDVTPKNLKTEVPTIMAPGLAETPEVIKPSIKELFDKGRRVISLSHAASTNGARIENKDMDFPEEEIRKAASILTVIESKELDKVDVVAHSEGAINSSIAASIRPERFRNMVLVSPGGMIEDENFSKLRKRFTEAIKGAINMAERDGVPEKRRELIQTKLINILKYVTQNPIAALREAQAISNSQIEDSLADLNKRGIGVSIVHGVDDPIFPMEKVQKTANGNGIEGFYSVRGGHSEMYLDAPRYMKLVDQVLDDLEEKQKNSS